MTLVVSQTHQVLQRLNLDGLSFISAWLIRHRFKQENFMSRCCINFTLQLMQLKHISDPSVIKAMNNAVEIRLNNFDRFLYMQHISDHHLSIYLISSNHLLKNNLSFIYPCLTFVEQYILFFQHCLWQIQTLKTCSQDL